MLSRKKNVEQGTLAPCDRDATTRRTLDRLLEENRRLKALVVSLSELVVKNAVASVSDKHKKDTAKI